MLPLNSAKSTLSGNGSAFLVFLKPSRRRGKAIFLHHTGKLILGSIDSVVHVLQGLVKPEQAVTIGAPIYELENFRRGPTGFEADDLHEGLNLLVEDASSLVLRSSDMMARRRAIHEARRTSLFQETLQASIAKSRVLIDLYEAKAEEENYAVIMLDDAIGYFSMQRADTMQRDQLKLAVKRAMLEDVDRFIADRDNLLQTDRFFARPKSELEDLTTVRDWVYRGMPEVEAFLASIAGKKMVESTRQRFIRVLKASLANHLSIQGNPYVDLVGTLVKRASASTDHTSLAGQVVELLKRIGELDEWANLPLLDPLAPTATWDAPVAESTNELMETDELDALRRDYGDLPVYAIDGATALEIDDAIAVEAAQDKSTWIHVHIADPTSALPPRHYASLAAQDRMASIYAVERHWPMLAAEVVERSKINLGDRNPQRTIVFSARVSKQGEVLEERIEAGWTNRILRCTYEQVDGKAETVGRKLDELPPSAKEDLERMREVAKALHDRRAGDALLIGDYPRTQIAYTSSDSTPSVSIISGGPPAPVADEKLSSNEMVAECMILANRIAARYCSTHSLPVLYRTLPPPLPSTPASLSLSLLKAQRDANGLVPWRSFVNADIDLGSPLLSLNPAAHIGIGSLEPETGYLQVTSPLRRFTDLLAHYQIRSHLLGRSSTFTKGRVEGIAKDFNAAAKGRRRFERRMEAHWALYALRDRVGEVVEAVVVREGQWRANDGAIVGTVLLPSCGGVRALCRATGGVGEDLEALARRLDRGREVQVKIDRVVLDMQPQMYTSLVQ